MRKPNFPQESGLFLGSNPPSNGQNILKNAQSGPNYREINPTVHKKSK
jgi:hypothetical protein